LYKRREQRFGFLIGFGRERERGLEYLWRRRRCRLPLHLGGESHLLLNGGALVSDGFRLECGELIFLIGGLDVSKG
jgi:hypothetical protein